MTVKPKTQPVALVITAALALLIVSVNGQGQTAPQGGSAEPGFRFRSGVELITVTVTVTDQTGRFVPGLRHEDFVVYEDDQPVEVTHFSAERLPVILGLVLDTSASMAGEKIREAMGALDRFAYDLLDQRDELFVYRFSNYPALVQGWTTDRQLISRVLGRMTADGGTAMYDAVIEALPLAARGRHPKKALVVISDGNDTSSRSEVREVKQRIRESEVLVYAIGLDSHESERKAVPRPPARVPFPIPRPFPPRRPGLFPLNAASPQFGSIFSTGDDRVNVAALRDMTDDSGGRTEIVREARDLNPATAAIADELSKQYNLGYPAPGKNDHQWHSIRVEVRRGAYRVRARRGYVAN